MRNLNHVDKALDITSGLLQGRAALKQLLGDHYDRTLKPWRDEIKRKMEKTDKTPIALLRDYEKRVRDDMILLMLISATLEIIEERDRK